MTSQVMNERLLRETKSAPLLQMMNDFSSGIEAPNDDNDTINRRIADAVFDFFNSDEMALGVSSLDELKQIRDTDSSRFGRILAIFSERARSNSLPSSKLKKFFETMKIAKEPDESRYDEDCGERAYSTTPASPANIPCMRRPVSKGQLIGLERGEHIADVAGEPGFVSKFNGSSTVESRTLFVKRARLILDTIIRTLYEKRDAPLADIQSKHIAAARADFMEMYHCDDIAVKEQSLLRIIYLNDIGIIEAKIGYGLDAIIEDLRKELSAENFSAMPVRLQDVIVRAFASSIKRRKLLFDSEKLSCVTEEIWQSWITTLGTILDMNSSGSREVIFWAKYARELVVKMPSNVSNAARAIEIGAHAGGGIVKAVINVVSASERVAQQNYFDAVGAGSGALQEAGQNIIEGVRLVGRNVKRGREWALALLSFEEACFKALDDRDLFRRTVLERAQNFMHEKKTLNPFEQESNQHLVYGVVTFLEYVVLNSRNGDIREEALKLIFQYSVLKGDIIKERVVRAFITILFNVSRLNDDDESKKLSHTAYAVLCYCQKSDEMPRGVKELIAHAFEKNPVVAGISQEICLESTLGRLLSMNVIRFVMRWIADIKSREEYGGSSLVTLLSHSHKDHVIPALFSWISDIFPQQSIEPDIYGNTPYHIAARQGNVAMIRHIAEQFKKLDINARDNAQGADSGYTALHYAAQRCDLNTMEELLRLDGIHPQMVDMKGNTPLHVAIMSSIALKNESVKEDELKKKAAEDKRSAEKEIEDLSQIKGVRKANKEKIRQLKRTIIDCQKQIAVSKQCMGEIKTRRTSYGNIVKQLLDKMSDVNAINYEGRTALDIAIENDSVSLALDLIDHSGKVADEIYHEKGSAIVVAARHRSLEVLQELIKRRVELTKAKDGEAYLSFLESFIIVDRIFHDYDTRASDEELNRHRSFIEKFARYHADLLQKYPHYRLSFEKFTYRDSRFLSSLTTNKEGVFTRNVRVSAANFQTQSPLFPQGRTLIPREQDDNTKLIKWSYGRDAGNVTERITSHNNEIGESNYFGLTPLHAAVLGKKHETVSLLIEKSAAIDARTIDGFTPLHLAALLRDPISIQTLIDNKADPSLQNDYGDTFVDILVGYEPQTLYYVQRMTHECFSFSIPERSDDSPFLPFLEQYSDKQVQPKGNGDNLLHRATHHGSLEMACFICKKNKKFFFEKNKRGRIPLQEAVEAGRFDMVERLIRSYPESSTCGLKQLAHDLKKSSGVSLGNLLACCDLVDLFKEYYKADSFMIATPENEVLGLIPLHVAAREGSMKILSWYIEQNLPLDAVDSYGNSSSVHAVLCNKFGALDRLVASGADCTIVNNDGRLPLHIAASKGLDDAVQLLMTQGGGETKDFYGNTPLHMACAYGRATSAKILFEHDPETFFIANDERYPLHTVSINGHDELFTYFVSDVVKRKIKEYCKERHIKPEHIIDMTDIEGATPLLLAAQNGCLPIVQWCVEHGADITHSDFSGENVVHKALHNSHRSVVAYLAEREPNLILEKGESLLEVIDADGEPPAHEIAKRGNTDHVIEILQDLIRLNVDLWSKDLRGKRLIHKICCYGSTALWRPTLKTKLWLRVHPLRDVALTTFLRDNNGETVFHDAAKSGHMPSIQLFIKESHIQDGARRIIAHRINRVFDDSKLFFGINRRKDRDGETPLHKAVRYRHYDAAKYMLKERSKLACDRDGKKIVFRKKANEGKRRTIVHMLLDQESLSSDDLGFLYYMCRRWPSMLKKRDHEGRTPFHVLAQKSRDVHALKIMLSFVPGRTMKKKIAVIEKRCKGESIVSIASKNERCVHGDQRDDDYKEFKQIIVNAKSLLGKKLSDEQFDRILQEGVHDEDEVFPLSLSHLSLDSSFSSIQSTPRDIRDLRVDSDFNFLAQLQNGSREILPRRGSLASFESSTPRGGIPYDMWEVTSEISEYSVEGDSDDSLSYASDSSDSAESNVI